MSTNLMTFDFQQQPVRAVLGADGEPRWIAKDVCDVLQIGNSRQALSRLDNDQKDVILTDTLGGKQEMSAVTADVLPAIRRTGRYAAPAAEPEARIVISKDQIYRRARRG